MFKIPRAARCGFYRIAVRCPHSEKTEDRQAATGERPEIGWTTDPAGQFMLGGSAGPMLAWAQAADSIPINYVDEKTGKPISLVQYPSAALVSSC